MPSLRGGVRWAGGALGAALAAGTPLPCHGGTTHQKLPSVSPLGMKGLWGSR